MPTLPPPFDPTVAPGREPEVAAMLGAWWRATLAAVVVGVLVAGAGFAVGSYVDRHSSDDWAGLGWLLLGLAAALALSLLTAALVTWGHLRRRRASYAGQVALVVPLVAVVLGVPTGGLGALAAVPVAWWLVRGLHASSRLGWGDSAGQGIARWNRTGALQRALIALVVGAVAGLVVLDRAGHAWGGQVHGAWAAWAVAAVVAALPSLLVVRRAWPLAVLVPAVLAGVLATAVPDAVRYAHPSTDRVVRDVDAAALPDGAKIGQRRVSQVAWNPSDAALPLMVVDIHPVGAAPVQVPDLLVPVEDGFRYSSQVAAVTSDDLGRQLAGTWADELEAAGWTRTSARTLYPPSCPDSGGYPEGTEVLERGAWQRAVVVPVSGGAVLVACTRA